MENPVKKADVLIEALPYIQDFRDATIIIKFGGSAMEEKTHSEGILKDVTFMECVGMNPVIVHGGGKAISRAMQRSGLKANFVRGLRVTCEKSIEIVAQVIREEINPEIITTLQRMGARAQCLPGETIFRVKKVSEIDEQTGATLDWGFVGEPVEVLTAPILEIIASHAIPVITPLGTGPDGKLYNINADTAAAAVARALKARKLVFLSDVPGLLRDVEDPNSLIATLRADEVAWLIEKGAIDGGMIPKVRSAVEALQAGVRKVHMIDGRMAHSLLLEIFTDKGVGTEIVRND